MNYRLDELDSGTFEKMVNTICQNVLGVGVVSFAPGKDGGRDGKFTGTATKYPDSQNPWSGRFIIQSKHTANPIASCADTDFDSIVKEEIKKINKLIAAGEVDCYMLFTNRKYGGISGDNLCKKIQRETGLSNVVILGKETINDHHLTPNKAIVKQYGLDRLHIPFDFSDEKIKELILAFKVQLPSIAADLLTRVDKLKYDFDRIKLSDKNALNNLGDEYYINEIVARSLSDFDKLQTFLEDPINDELKEQYYDIASELSQIITIKRSNFDAFEEIFMFAYQLIADGNTTLKGGKRHITTLLHYMYFECLIGLK